MDQHLRSAFRKMAMRHPGAGVYLDDRETMAVVDEMNRAPVVHEPETIDMAGPYSEVQPADVGVEE